MSAENYLRGLPQTCMTSYVVTCRGVQTIKFVKRMKIKKNKPKISVLNTAYAFQHIHKFIFIYKPYIRHLSQFFHFATSCLVS